jgi:hypothetical protein
MRELHDNIDVKRGISPAAATIDNTPFVSQILDMQGLSSAEFIILCGALADADATFTVLAEEGETPALSDNTAVDDRDLLGLETQAGFDVSADNEPLMRSLQSAFSGGINLSGFGFNPIAGITGSAQGNVFAGGRIIPFVQGGVVDSPSIAPMALFGEAGPEAIVPLKRGSDGNLGIAASGGGRGVNVTVNVHNAPAGVQSQTSRVDSNGNVAVDVMLNKWGDGMVANSLSNGSGLRVLKQDFGIKRFTGQ